MELLSCNIIEKDCNNDVLWTWTYPSITEEQRAMILRKCDFVPDQPFLFGKYKKEWFYINFTEVFESDNLPGVKQLALVLWSCDLNPEKYKSLCRILCKTYCKTGNAALLLKLFLSVLTRGACTTEENGTYYTKDFEQSSSQNDTTMLRELIRQFGLQTIVIYTALLLKKRLVIYHHSLFHLLKWMRTFPALMAHRHLLESLYPWLDLCADDTDQLSGNSCYIAGFRDSRILSRVDLFDVLVNLPASEITIAPHAKESMSMTKAHKEIALFMVQLVERDGLSESQVTREISEKTQELLSQLRTLATKDSNGRKVLSVESLRMKKFSPAVENFLFQLALAENILS